MGTRSAARPSVRPYLGGVVSAEYKTVMNSSPPPPSSAIHIDNDLKMLYDDGDGGRAGVSLKIFRVAFSQAFVVFYAFCHHVSEAWEGELGGMKGKCGMGEREAERVGRPPRWKTGASSPASFALSLPPGFACQWCGGATRSHLVRRRPHITRNLASRPRAIPSFQR